MNDSDAMFIKNFHDMRKKKGIKQILKNIKVVVQISCSSVFEPTPREVNLQ